VGEWEGLQGALPPRFRERVVRRELLPLQLIEERLPEQVARYVEMQRVVHDIISTAFSERVIRPGETRTDDVVWWMRQRVNDLGLGTWFQPSVDVQRAGVEMGRLRQPRHPPRRRAALRLRDHGAGAEHGHAAHGLRPAPRRDGRAAGLRAALARGNRLQDILLEEMRPGRTGNQVLAAARARMRTEGIDGTIYTHPIGAHGHGAGPLIGLWDRQEGVPGRGDVPLRPNTWFSIELQATTPVPEWNGRPVRMGLEEEARLDESGARHWVLRRQERFHLVGG
jgi:hypothetical protein